MSFAGVTVTGAADWDVINVDGVPGCVRYDQPAVFLGTPSESTCPAHLVGRTTTVQILRGSDDGTAGDSAADGETDSDGATSGGSALTVARDSAGDVIVSAGGRVRVIVTSDGGPDALAETIAATVVVGSRSIGMTQVSEATTVARPGDAGTMSTGTSAVVPDPGGSGVAPLTASPMTATATPAATSTTFTGLAFDTCAAPSVSDMQTWKANSPYGGVGIYIGGVTRGCAQPNLTAVWIAAVHQQGWRTLPIYVGLQAPCSTYAHRVSTKLSTARSQGKAAANDAVVQMQSLGLAQGNPVYYDMESWDNTDTACTSAVLAFTQAWVQQLHAAGYLAGFYSSASTGITALVHKVQSDSTYLPPDAIWIAAWENPANTSDPRVPDNMWKNHQRVKQYDGGDNYPDQTYGGVTISIDSDAVDGPTTNAASDTWPRSLPIAAPGQPYSAKVVDVSGNASFSYSVKSGSVLPGLTLSDKGVISGTPTGAIGTKSTVTIQVTDSAGATVTGTFPMYVRFTDVPPGSTFYSSIVWLAQSGVTSGYSDGSFQPSGDVHRQEMAAFLYRLANDGATPADCTSQPFPDVPTDDIFCPFITWLRGTDITSGDTHGNFDPTTPVYRGEMAAFLYRFAKPGTTAPACTKKPFPDVATSNVFCGDIAWVKANGISLGYSDGSYGPSRTVARGEMSAFLERLAGLS